jgi:hypothetical protein
VDINKLRKMAGIVTTTESRLSESTINEEKKRLGKDDIVHYAPDTAEFAKWYVAGNKADYAADATERDDANREKFQTRFTKKTLRSGFMGGGEFEYTDTKTGDVYQVTVGANGKGFYGTDHRISVSSQPMDEAKGPCWTGYQQVGMKKKNGKQVPNCVPESADPVTEAPATDTLTKLKKIVDDKQAYAIKFEDGSMKVDLYTASAILKVYEAVNSENKSKIQNLLKTKAGVMKVAKFAFKNLGESTTIVESGYEDRVNSLASYINQKNPDGVKRDELVSIIRFANSASGVNAVELRDIVSSNGKASNAGKEFLRDVAKKVKVSRAKSEKMPKAELLSRLADITAEEAGNSLPDGDPWDNIFRRARKLPIPVENLEYRLIDWLDAAAKKHLGVKSYHGYLDQIWKGYADGDYGNEPDERYRNVWGESVAESFDDEDDEYAQWNSDTQPYADAIIRRLNATKKMVGLLQQYGLDRVTDLIHDTASAFQSDGADIGSSDVSIMVNFLLKSLENPGTIGYPNESAVEEAHDFADDEQNPAAAAIMWRLKSSGKLLELLKAHGLDNLMNAIDDVASFHADAEELGSSDVSIMVKQVIDQLR